jgi:hypothetical protein
VTTNYRTKPNPLLQYHTGPTFPPAMRQPGGVGGGYPQQMKQASYGDYYSVSPQMQQQAPGWGYQDISHMQPLHQRGDPSRRAQYSTMQYQQRRQRRSYESGSQSLPSTRQQTPTHGGAGYGMPPGGPMPSFVGMGGVTPMQSASLGGIDTGPTGIGPTGEQSYAARPSTGEWLWQLRQHGWSAYDDGSQFCRRSAVHCAAVVVVSSFSDSR